MTAASKVEFLGSRMADGGDAAEVGGPCVFFELEHSATSESVGGEFVL